MYDFLIRLDSFYFSSERLSIYEYKIYIDLSVHPHALMYLRIYVRCMCVFYVVLYMHVYLQV